jgi:hypothetical protein
LRDVTVVVASGLDEATGVLPGQPEVKRLSRSKVFTDINNDIKIMPSCVTSGLPSALVEAVAGGHIILPCPSPEPPP